MTRFRPFRAALAALIAASLAIPAGAQWNSGAMAPAVEKSRPAESLRLAPDAIVPAARVVLAPVDPAAVEAMKEANTRTRLKRLQIGLPRAVGGEPQASSAALRWASVPGGLAAHWEVTSPGARALRIALRAPRLANGVQIRVAGSADATVYGPFTARDFPAGDGAWWSPVVEGETATIELFAPDVVTAARLSIAIAQVSHLVASPMEPKLESQLKQASQSCEVDLICRSSSDGALANTGKAVARMIFSDDTGSVLCTGTLLNPTDGSFTPYFYTANHCIDTQQVANTLETFWFYDAVACGVSIVNPDAVQVTGGARLLYGNASSDATLLKLNQRPPGGAFYSGWDARSIATGTPMVGVHHPWGDPAKVSLGTMGGYATTTLASGSLITVNWNSTTTGFTEPGSSGSGIFTSAGSEYVLRGGLLGGPDEFCNSPLSDLHDYYSRLDQVYPSIAQYLDSAPAANYTALWNKTDEPGWGVNFDQQGDIVFATLFTYDEAGAPMWLVMSNGARQGSGDSFSGALYRTTGPAFNANPFSPAVVSFVTVGNLSVSFSSANSGTLTYTYNGKSVTKAITKQTFGQVPTCIGTFGDRSSLTNYQDLWWGGAAESGWGINIAHQDNTLFATLFTYDASRKGMWLDMPGGTLQGDGTYLGDLYVVMHGSAFDAQPFAQLNPGDVRKVGTMRLQFQNGTHGALTYTVDGATVTKSITRQEFSGPLPACAS